MIEKNILKKIQMVCAYQTNKGQKKKVKHNTNKKKKRTLIFKKVWVVNAFSLLFFVLAMNKKESP